MHRNTGIGPSRLFVGERGEYALDLGVIEKQRNHSDGVETESPLVAAHAQSKNNHVLTKHTCI